VVVLVVVVLVRVVQQLRMVALLICGQHGCQYLHQVVVLTVEMEMTGYLLSMVI
jgi:hypothetical protein